MSDASSVYDLLLELLKEGLVGPLVTYADVAASTLFVWDYILTLDMEIKLIWRSKWNTIKVVYLIQRYMPFIDCCYMTLYRQLTYHLTLHQCERFSFATGISFIIGIIVSEILLGLRAWAVWNRSKTLAYILPIAFVIIFGGAFTGIYFYLKSLRFAVDPFPGVSLPGCFVIAGGNTTIWSWVALMVWNCITLVLIVVPGYRAYRSGVHSELASLIYRDGAYYYAYLFIFSTLNIVFTTTFPPAKRVMVTSLERCLHSVFASRVLLHMRQQVKESANKWSINSVQQGRSYNGTTGVTTIIDISTDQGSPISPADSINKAPFQSYQMQSISERV